MSNKIVYEDYAVGASDYAEVNLSETDNQTSGGSDIYNINSIFNGTASEYASFDDGGIYLNENFNLYSGGNYTKVGFVSSTISDLSCHFLTPPKLTIQFTGNKSFSGNGITLYFAKHYCTSVKVEYFSGNTLLATYQKDDIASKEAYLPTTVAGYNKIRISFLATEFPNQYAKVYKLTFGHTTNIENFRSISFNKKLDFYGSDISIGTLDVQFLSDIEMNFYENQKLKLYHNNVLIGTYWVAESERQTDKLYSVTAEDVFSRLDAKYLNLLFAETYAPANLNDPYRFGIDFQDFSNIIGNYISMTVTGDDPSPAPKAKGAAVQNNLRRILAEVAFCFGKHARALNDGTIEIFVPKSTSAKQISSNEIIGDATYRDSVPVSNVNLRIKKLYGTYSDRRSGDILAEGVTLTTTPIQVKSSEPTQTLALYQAENQIPYASDDEGYLSNYTVTAYEYFSPSVKSTHNTYQDVSIYSVPFKTETKTLEKSRETNTGTRSSDRSFGDRIFYRIDNETWINEIANKAFSVVGEVRAKIITDDIDVGDYVSIVTKYSGTKYGTVTEISADVGYNDIVKDVVVTVWQ